MQCKLVWGMQSAGFPPIEAKPLRSRRRCSGHLGHAVCSAPHHGYDCCDYLGCRLVQLR